MEPIPTFDSHAPELQKLQEEVKAQMAITAKAKQATYLFRIEIERLRSKLWQSSDREENIRAKGRKATKALQDKLDPEIVSHAQTTTELKKQKDEVTWSEGIIATLWEVA